MSLRVRLILVAAGAVAAAVALASVVVFFLVRGELRGQVDDSLRATATRMLRAPFFAKQPPTPGDVVIALPRPRFGSPNQYLQVVDVKGKPFRDPTDTVPLPIDAQTRAVASGTTGAYFGETHVDGVHLRVLTFSLPGLGVAVQIARPLTEVDGELGRIELWLALVAIGGVALASAAGFGVARAALRPVRRLTDTAEHVTETGDLRARIDVEGKDELARLAASFNTMLEALDDAARSRRQLVADASHELRTPLTSLRTNIEVLATGRLPESERGQLLSDVVEQLGEMSRLVSELVELAKGDETPTLEPEEVRLDLLAEEAVARARRNYPRVRVDAELEPTLVHGVPASLERAVGNLLDNAAKWSPPGGCVSVVLRDGQLAVRDNGPGIAEEDLPHVFERFYRSLDARSMPGSGLGLAIVKQVADAHGGSVGAERAPGGGTLMRLCLPVLTSS